MNLPKDTSPLKEASAKKEYETEFPTRNALINYVKERGMREGFAVTIRKSSVRDSWVRLGCDRGGNYRRPHYLPKNSSINHRKDSNLIGCPYEIRGRKPVGSDRWLLETRNLEHNHELCNGFLSSHRMLRRLSHAEMDLVKSLTEQGLKPQQILMQLRERFPGNLSTIKTIYDARKILRRKADTRSAKLWQGASTEKQDILHVPMLHTPTPTIVPMPSHSFIIPKQDVWLPTVRPWKNTEDLPKLQYMTQQLTNHWYSLPTPYRTSVLDALEKAMEHVYSPDGTACGATEFSQRDLAPTDSLHISTHLSVYPSHDVSTPSDDQFMLSSSLADSLSTTNATANMVP